MRMYSHAPGPHDHDFDVEEEFWPIMGILFAIIGVWTGIVHLIDWVIL